MCLRDPVGPGPARDPPADALGDRRREGSVAGREEPPVEEQGGLGWRDRGDREVNGAVSQLSPSRVRSQKDVAPVGRSAVEDIYRRRIRHRVLDRAVGIEKFGTPVLRDDVPPYPREFGLRPLKDVKLIFSALEHIKEEGVTKREFLDEWKQVEG